VEGGGVHRSGVSDFGGAVPHRNTRGSVLGNIIQVMGTEYKQMPFNAQVATVNGNTTITQFYRLPSVLTS